MSLDIPFNRTISHYRVVEKLGGGGMGVVYKAEDTAFTVSSPSNFCQRIVARERRETPRLSATPLAQMKGDPLLKNLERDSRCAAFLKEDVSARVGRIQPYFLHAPSGR